VDEQPDQRNEVEAELELDSIAAEQPRETGPARRVEKTRSLLAYLILALLALVILYMLVLLTTHTLDTEEFANVAGVLLAPLVGLLGAATGYYYGRG
jgi:L-asparagine transporter-like permease